MPEGEITPPADAALPDNSDAEISDEGKEEQGQDQQQNQDQQQIQDQQQGQGQAQEQSDGKDDLQPQEGEAGALPSDDPAVPITVELSNDGQQDAFPKIGWPGEMGVDLYSSPTLDAESHLIVAGQEQELLLSGYADSAQEWYELTYLNESWYTFVKDVLLSPPENVEEETPQTLSLLQPSLLSMAVAPAAKPGFPCDAWIDGAFGADLYSEPTLAAANHLVITDAALPLTLLGYAGDGEEWYQLLYQEETWYAPAGTLLLEAPEKDEPAESPVAFAMPAMTMLAAAPAADTDTVTVLLKKNTDGLVYSHIKLSRQAVANGTQDPRVILTSRLEDLYCDVYPASEWDKLATLATDTQTEYSLTIARRNTYNTVHTEIACQNGTEITTLADYYEGLSGLDGEQVALNYTELVRQTPLGFRPVAQTAPVVTLDSSEESIDTEPFLVVADSSPSTDEKYFAYHIIYYEWDDTTTNFFTVSNRKSTVSAIEPDTVSSTINSDSAWKAETSANWITLSSRGEGRGQSTLAITATNNISFSSRKAIITVKNATGSIAITVSQAALENGLYIFSEDGKLLKASNDYKPIPSQYISSNKPLRLKIISNLDWSAAAIEYIATPARVAQQYRVVKGYALSPASGKKKQVTTLTVTLTGKEDARLSVTAKGQKAELLLKARNSVPAPQPVAYFITYNLNGGTDGNGVPTDQQSTEDSRNITTCIPLRTDYVFLGWTDTKDATVAKYQPGAEYTGNKNITLYAVWAPFVLGQYHLKMDKEARGFVLTVSPRFTPVNGYPKLFAVSDADWIVPGKITGSKTYTADTSNVDHVIPYDPGLRYEDKERSEMYFKGGFVLWLKANKNKENWNADSRSGKVTVTYQASADAPEIKQVLNITQNGNNPYDKPKPDDMLKVSPIEISFRTNKADGKDDVTITSNKKGLVWEPIVEKDAKAWLSVEGWQPGMGSGTLSIKVTDNPSPLSRRSVITFKRTSGGNTSKDDPTICVFQPGKDETWLWPSTYYKKYVNGFYNTYFTTITKNDVKTTLSTMHTGIDIKTSDSAVVATLSGVLVYSVETSGLSEMSILLCYQGEMYVSSYVHMIDQVYKGIGTWIDRGKEIGTGWNIGTDFKHLHFRISKLTGTDADDAYKYYCSIRDGHPDSSVAWSYTSSDTSYMIDPSPKDTPYMRQLIRPDQDSFGDAIFSPDGIEYAFDY